MNARPRPPPTPAATRPEPFLLAAVLPHLVSPFPTRLPPAVLSRSAQEAIHFLSLDPENEAYWTLGRKDDAVALRRRELTEAGNMDDLVLSRPYYAHDPEELRCLVTLSLPHAGASEPGTSLGVVLAWEEQPSALMAMQSGQDGTDLEKDDTRPGWTFLELQAFDRTPDQVTISSGGGKARRVWFDSVHEAEAASGASSAAVIVAAAATEPSSLVDSRSQEASRPAPLDIPSSQYSFDHTGQDDEDEGYRDPAFGGRPATTTDPKGAVAGMAEGEGTTPGAYGSPNDFWANWSDDEGAAGEASARWGGQGPGSATRTPPSREAEDQADEAYWAAYGGVDSVVGDDREEDERPPRAHERETTARSTMAAAAAGEEPPKTRTRRSSTVTPYKVAGQQQFEFLTEANVQAASSMAAAAAAAAAADRPALPRSQSHASAGFAYPLDVGALSERLTRAQSRGADSDDETDVDLRLALEGIWRMYVGRGLTDADELEDKRQRFGRVVAGVLAAEV
ncbi:hypothetical protein JCM3774_006001 [Rhodotorula dairenensis]